MVLAEGLDRYERAVTAPVTRVERSWAGLRTFAPDKTPVAGYDPRAEGFFWLAGQGGYGIQTAPALSLLAARLVRAREATEGPRHCRNCCRLHASSSRPPPYQFVILTSRFCPIPP